MKYITYQIFKLDSKGILRMVRITQNHAVRNIVKKEILYDGFSCVIMKYVDDEFLGKEVF